ncbi:hypothetical protein V5799_023973 [Amblyomma americanum]|uniref:Uncharacterized protein n=1 Tax=Amblyomma americanum TaxID=6943 RepID=A0AAQ4EDZ6_AMBAM
MLGGSGVELPPKRGSHAAAAALRPTPERGTRTPRFAEVGIWRGTPQQQQQVLRRPPLPPSPLRRRRPRQCAVLKKGESLAARKAEFPWRRTVNAGLARRPSWGCAL